MMLLTLRRATASFFFKEFDELISVFSDFSWLHFFAQFTAFIYRWPLNVTCWRASEHALPERRESAYGYKQTSSRPKSTSALPPKADILVVITDFRL